MKKKYMSPLLQQHEYVQELAAGMPNVSTYGADNDVAFDNDAWA